MPDPSDKSVIKYQEFMPDPSDLVHAHSANIPLERSFPTAGCPRSQAATRGTPTSGMAVITPADATKAVGSTTSTGFITVDTCSTGNICMEEACNTSKE